MVEFSDVVWPCTGRNNPGGTQTIAYYASICDFTTIPKVPASPSILAAAAIISDEFNFKPGKGFHKFYSTQDAGNVKSEGVGEIDGRSFKHMGSLFHPGTEDEAAGFASSINNASTIWVIVQADGKKRVIGSEAFPAKITSMVEDSGTKTEDRKGFSFTLESKGFTVAPIYTGAIKHKPSNDSSGSGSEIDV